MDSPLPDVRAAARTLMDLELLRRRLAHEGAAGAANLSQELFAVESRLRALRDPLAAELGPWRAWLSSCTHLLARDDRWLARDIRLLQHALSIGRGPVAEQARAWMERWRGCEAFLVRRSDGRDNLMRAIETGLGPIAALLPHPDGRRLWSACGDKIVLWDGETGARVATLAGHEGPVRALCAAPPFLASTDAGGILRLWNTEDHSAVATVTAHDGAANALALSPETGLLASAGEDGFVRTWRVPSLAPVGDLHNGKACLRAVACLGEDTWISGGGVDCVAVLWIGAPGVMSPTTVAGPGAAVTAIAACDPLVSALGGRAEQKGSGKRWAVIVSEDGQAYLCTGQDKEVRPYPAGRGAHLLAVATRPGSTTVVAGSRDSVLYGCNLTKPGTVDPIGRHCGPVTAAIAGAPPDVVISGGQDQVIAWWGKAEGKWRGHAGTVSCLVRRDRFICSGGHDGDVLWFEGGRPIGRSEAPENGPVTAMTGGREFIFAGHESGQVLVHRLRAGQSSNGYMGKHDGPVSALAYETKSNTLVSAGWDGTLFLWTLGSPIRQRYELSDHRGCVLGLAIDPQRDLVLSAGWDREILTHSLSRRMLLGRLAGHKSPVVALQVCGATLVSADDSGRIGFCALDSLDTVTTQGGHSGSVNALVASAGRVLSAGDDGFVNIWSVAERKRLHRVQVSSAAIRALAPSPDGHYAAVACADACLRVLSLESGEVCAGWMLGAGATTCDWTGPDVVCGTRSGEVLRFDFLPPRLLLAASWHPERLLLAALHSDGVLSLGEWHDGAGFLEPLAVRALGPDIAERSPEVRWSSSGRTLRITYSGGAQVLDAFTLASVDAPSEDWAPPAPVSPDGQWRATTGSTGVRPA